MLNIRRLIYISIAALIGLQIYWYSGVVSNPNAKPSILFLALFPWIVSAMLWLKNPWKGLVFAGLISLIYFCHGVILAWSEPSQRWLGLIEALLVGALCLGLGVIAILEKRQKKQRIH